MAPLPESNTKRYWLMYTVGPHPHSILMRTSDSVTDAQAIDELESFWADMFDILYADAVFTHVERSNKGSNVRNSLAIAASLPGASGNGNCPEIQRPRSWTIKGRSEDGRRSGVTFFGVALNTPATWEQDPISESEFASVRARMNAVSGMYLSISEEKPSWYNRVTVTYNDHWVDEARG